ncbi:hypothetical protein RS9916_29509 [Synechococcus sp. RS9916]|nr:hypothetical protein RS9916_29509 [Synechococcus sp. RS9916]
MDGPVNAAKAEILLLAPDLLGESLALQLTSEVPSWSIALRSDELNRHPQLVIWSLDSTESIALLHQELIRLQEHWQPAPVLLLLPASVAIPAVDLLSLDIPGLLQAPDLNTLREAIETLLQGGRVVRLAQANPSTPPPQPAMGLGQWLLTSGLQQITNDLQVIDALLVPPPDNLLLRLMLEGRQRELQSARSLLLLLWGPLQIGLADVQPLGQRQTTVSQPGDLTIDGNGMAITVRERNAIAVWSSIQERLSQAVDAGVSNGTGSLLAIEGLQPERRRDLLLSLLQQLDQVMARLRAPSVSSDSSNNLPIDAQWDSLQPELRRQAIQAMAGSYVHLPRGDQLQPVAQHLINASDLSQNDDDLPDPRRMLEPLVRDQPVLVNGQLLPADHPKALLQLETLVSNWLVRSAELISAELLGLCGDWPELRRYLLDERLLPTRDLERLRNQLNNQSRWQLWVKRPVQLYESQRLLYQLRGGSIAPLLLIEPRDEELRRLGWWQQQVALLLEARDAIAPQMQALVQRIGDLMVVVLTQVIGRAIGLVGRGIAQGMGRSWQRGSTNRG